MNAFAGFWVDGAVRKPGVQNLEREGYVIAKWKNNPNAEFDLLLRQFREWNDVYWLDTTPRESLTPEELFSVVKVLWPECKSVNAPGMVDVVQWLLISDDDLRETPIDWGNLTQYPPPVEPQWIRITRENVGQYLFRECRFRDVYDSWHNGTVVGWDIIDDCCLVSSDRSETEPVLQWNIVEVQA